MLHNSLWICCRLLCCVFIVLFAVGLLFVVQQIEVSGVWVSLKRLSRDCVGSTAHVCCRQTYKMSPVPISDTHQSSKWSESSKLARVLNYAGDPS